MIGGRGEHEHAVLLGVHVRSLRAAAVGLPAVELAVAADGPRALVVLAGLGRELVVVLELHGAQHPRVTATGVVGRTGRDDVDPAVVADAEVGLGAGQRGTSPSRGRPAGRRSGPSPAVWWCMHPETPAGDQPLPLDRVFQPSTWSWGTPHRSKASRISRGVSGRAMACSFLVEVGGCPRRVEGGCGALDTPAVRFRSPEQGERGEAAERDARGASSPPRGGGRDAAAHGAGGEHGIPAVDAQRHGDGATRRGGATGPATDPASASTNCGRTATKNSTVLGLSRSTSRPGEVDARRARGPERRVLDRRRRRHPRSSWTPSQAR